jgi:hypothetical protein
MIFAPERRNANHERSQTFDIRGYGNSAVVTGRAVQKGAENGEDYSGDYWFTRVRESRRPLDYCCSPDNVNTKMKLHLANLNQTMFESE